MITRTYPISGELKEMQKEIESYALKHKLDFFEVHFEVCDYDTINILAAQGGFPARYPHWRFGMEYDQLSKTYAYGVQKIYEMVINNDPSYAYLLKGNNWVDQKTVMAHVYGHVDFFKNNAWFRHTNRSMIDVMANHGTKIRRYMDRFGQDQVENFIDVVLSIENLLDIGQLFETREKQRRRRELEEKAKTEEDKADNGEGLGVALRSFMRSYDRYEEEKGTKTKKKKQEGKKEEIKKIPLRPERDIMKFISDYAPLNEWQSDVIGILREEAYYFLPQRMTKIMNEGWASYWHSTIMTQDALAPSELVDFCDHHAGVMQMSKKQINPYKIGIELFRDIEYRWNTGRFGKDYLECDDLRAREHWDSKTEKGRDKIFEVRASHNDITFLDEYFTQEFCERQQLFTYKYNPRSGRFEIDTRDFLAIKQKLLSQLTNFGQPAIQIIDANYANRGELLIEHVHYGVDLDMNYAAQTLLNLHKLWKRPVNLSTICEDKNMLFHFDGKEMRPLNV